MYIPTLSENKTKNSIRELILDTIANNDTKYGRVLTLPCLDFTLENILSDKYIVHTVERELKYYRRQLDITKHNKRIVNYHNSLLNHVMTNKHYYDYAYLDMCGPLSEEIIMVLTAIKCKNIALTVRLQRTKKRWSKYYQNVNDMYETLFRSLGYKIKTEVKYKNSRSNMCTYFITRD